MNDSIKRLKSSADAIDEMADMCDDPIDIFRLKRNAYHLRKEYELRRGQNEQKVTE